MCLLFRLDWIEGVDETRLEDLELLEAVETEETERTKKRDKEAEFGDGNKTKKMKI